MMVLGLPASIIDRDATYGSSLVLSSWSWVHRLWPGFSERGGEAVRGGRRDAPMTLLHARRAKRGSCATTSPTVIHVARISWLVHATYGLRRRKLLVVAQVDRASSGDRLPARARWQPRTASPSRSCGDVRLKPDATHG